MGLLDSVKSYASKQSESGEDLVKKAEGYLGEERLGQIKTKVGEENFKKFEDQARSFLGESSEKKDSTETSGSAETSTESKKN
ncbi:uncharacterized protein KLLA0_E13069g [Kluyveromyces lactis]|uniref:KLLA0E13069p n=1 Tax=Kluyveromyces lactis (strain ATCC 8585 / CBS 2359 / DSM 70799 / NBRC 1267 / NRRL Y-1140 / WM37) TaxID=284590 RepID=Q6CNF0_KLULA|nr:uncharacterized protein KLLA0_E13069g [Kluyveromyces lactis]CAG99626.1 KLLA0E13069p [Kluyveromyces lactis]|eukprot:XP_454539.1 uncharacterized protein KLLA0_E13069g [Kluyveromyces lactis]